MRQFLPLFSLLFLPAISQAQTKPDKVVPLESRSESRALVQQLLQQGKIMAPSQAKRGMKGYALSVFQGTKVEKFGIEVLGVLERVQGGGDLVMIRVTDGPVVKRQSGIIQGMSGSPVYINGKLLGAIAIGFGFPKEPIGGVTPITQMIATALPDNAPAQTPSKVAFFEKTEIYRPKSSLHIGARRIAKLEVTRNANLSDFSGPNSGATMRMRPATQLLQLSGISQGSLPRWRAMLSPYGITPVMGGGAMSNRQVFGPSSKKTGIVTNLAPGAAIGVQLASGDIDATGIGTVTYRLGNRVLAFGHPMFGLGAVSMPMTTAYVHDIFPAYDISFKLGSPLQSVGELQQDTVFAIGGTVGRRAQTVPLRISLRDAAKKIDRKFNVRLIKDPLFTPQLAQGIAVEALQSTLGLDSDKTVRVAFSMGLKNGPAIRRVNTVYAGEQVIAGALGEMLDALSITQANQYEKGNITSLDLRVEVIGVRKTARIRRIYADKNRVKAGESVQISVEMEPTGQPDALFTRRFTIPVPEDAPNGSMRVAASSASDFFAGRVRVGGEPPRPGNFRELLAAYAQIGAQNELLIQTSTPGQFLLIDRKKIADPPPSWARLVPAGSSSSIGTFNETAVQREKSEWVLSGLESVSIPVESKRASDRQRPDAPAAGEDGSVATATDTSANSFGASDDDGDDLFVSRIANGKELDAAPDFARRAAPLLKVLRAQTAPQSPLPPLGAPTPGKTVVPPVPTATPAATPTPAPSTDATAKDIARPAGRWIQKTSADFTRGQFDGALVSNEGTLQVGPSNERVISTPEPLAWSIAAHGKGTIYLGTGNSARLFKIQNGVSKVLYEGPEVAVSALALAPDGTLYAGVSPGGVVYRFAADGKKEIVFQSGQTFVHALAFDKNGNLIVGTGGDKAAVYRLVNPGAIDAAQLLSAAQVRPQAWVALPQKHARSLAVSGDSIYVGTGEDAILYRIDAEGKTTALYQSTGSANSGFEASNENESANGSPPPATVGAAPPAPNTTQIFNQNSGATSSNFGRNGNEILSLAVAGQDVYFGTATSGSVFRWNAQKGVTELFKTSGRAVYALQMLNGALYAATGERGEVWRVSGLDGEISGARVLDATQPQVLSLASADSRIYAATGNNAAVYQIGGAGENSFTSNVFDAGQIVRFGALQAISSGANFEFRAGNTLEPDSTWSAWKVVTPGQSVGENSARYAQYRVKLGDSGNVSRVEIAFRAPNRAPRVTWRLPSGGEALSGKKTFSWTGVDPDKDALRYALEIQGADGKVQKVELTTPTASTQEIDLKKYSDGVYTAKVSASDAARNADEPLADSATSLPFTIDNTAPVLGTLAVKREEAVWKLEFTANDALSPLSGAEWRTISADPKAKAGDWQSVAAADGLFDSKIENGVANLDPALTGTSFKSGDSIEVRLRDAAGNAATSKVALP
ncbi:MAG TPA: SpoIVB peptidase S55 domain-containing protein [Abditibacterium sp.]|jgi:hypothetical protein